MKLIYGEDRFLIEHNLGLIKSQYDPNQVVIFQSEPDLEQVYQALNNNSLFASKKLIIIPDIISAERKFSKNDEQNTQLEVIQKNAFANTIDEIVFVFNSKELPNNAFVKKIAESCETIICNKLSNEELIGIAVNKFGENNIPYKYTDVMYLISVLPNNLSIIMNEIEKICLLNQPLSIELIDSFISKYGSDDPFEFSNAISKNDFNLIWQKYLQKKEAEENISLIIYSITNTFSLVNQIYWYKKSNFSISKIAAILNMNEKRVNIHSWILDKYGYKRVSKILTNLARLDVEIKTTKMEGYEVFEAFLVRNFAN
ncbi:DNA polymerase III subunit delta [Mycoplasma nasistruthionis]|uniref:DNA polymerase III subunit delta n=1 Tax=Mycoplasma nasistruthionis TaxID=353852 RepID=A0A4Y6I6F1_9MOLU|nr:hypothetical protein [Mycoplasma nasistruthionis]QDF64817.1 hypothetical protein FIV53_00610 [Mycoplasma nasistruthionis]